MTNLFAAIVICIGSPGPQALPTINGIPVSCDYGVWVDDNVGKGYTSDQCAVMLNNMHESGNVVKICVPVASSYVKHFSVEWNAPYQEKRQ